MKKKLLIGFGALFILSGIIHIPKDISVGLLTVSIGVLLIFWGLKVKVNQKSESNAIKPQTPSTDNIATTNDTAVKFKSEAQQGKNISIEQQSNKSKRYKKIFSFNVVGIPYDNPDGTSRRKILNQLIKDTRRTSDETDFYRGYSNKDIIDDYSSPSDKIYELEDISITDIELEPFEYEGSPAFYVNTEFGCVGCMPANDVENFLKYSNAGEIQDIYAYITGGKYKFVDLEEDDNSYEMKEVIATGEDDYGVEVLVELSMPVK